MTAAVTAELPQWSQYADGSWPTILIGNGLGINLWEGFRYASLFEQAGLPAEAQGIFTELGTTNFEAVLECLYHAGVAQTALHDDATRIDQAYGQVQHSLFTAVARSHVPWGTLSFWHHNVIAASLNKHSAVFTTNYDSASTGHDSRRRRRLNSLTSSGPRTACSTSPTSRYGIALRHPCITSTADCTYGRTT